MKNPESLDWYAFAKMDMDSAMVLNEHARPKPMEIICYHSQQSVEKMLKGYLISNGINAPRTHDLPLLCDMCLEISGDFSELVDICEFLTVYGIQPRYPNEIDMSEDDARLALKYSSDVRNFFEVNVFEDDVDNNADGDVK
jgi:HEPN domain-containing protein